MDRYSPDPALVLAAEPASDAWLLPDEQTFYRATQLSNLAASLGASTIVCTIGRDASKREKWRRFADELARSRPCTIAMHGSDDLAGTRSGLRAIYQLLICRDAWAHSSVLLYCHPAMLAPTLSWRQVPRCPCGRLRSSVARSSY